MATRGEHLVRADRRFATGAGLLGRIAAPGFKRILDLSPRTAGTCGGIDAIAARRIAAADRLSPARPGRDRSASTAGWRWCGWRRRVRSAGTRPGQPANGLRPTLSRCSNFSCSMAHALGEIGRAKGIRAVDQFAGAPAARQWAGSGAAKISPPIMTLATTSMPHGWTRA